MKNVLFALTLLVSAVALASDGAEHGAHEEMHIPLQEIGWQAANLGILLVALFFFLKKSVVESFAKKKTDFLAQAEKTKVALKQAEDELRDTKAKLANLENGEAKSLETAKHEANLIAANLIKDAEAQAAKIKHDAELTMRNELMKAKAEINALILNEAVSATKSKLNSSSTQNLQAVESQFLAQVENSKQAKAVH